jgi:hypothetical protein
MKRAINICWRVGAVGLLFGLMIYVMSFRVHWDAPLVAGVYISLASLGLLLIAGMLIGVDWVRKNVRIQ